MSDDLQGKSFMNEATTKNHKYSYSMLCFHPGRGNNSDEILVVVVISSIKFVKPDHFEREYNGFFTRNYLGYITFDDIGKAHDWIDYNLEEDHLEWFNEQ